MEWWERLDINAVARISQHFAQIPFLMRGWKIFAPHDHETQVDFIAYEESTQALERCQIKGTRSTKGSVSLFKGKANDHPGKPYEENDFDLVIIVMLPVCAAKWPSDQGIYFFEWRRCTLPSIDLTHYRLRDFRVDHWPGWIRQEKTKRKREDEQMELFHES